jgi:hypothetical protein
MHQRQGDGEEPMEIDKEAIDKRLTQYQKSEDTVGENGSLKQLTQAFVERAMEAERHLSGDVNRKLHPVG